jgi:hypothetical protein
LNQAFATNTALQNAGVGATIHGFNYGFNYRVGTGFFGCTAWNQDGSCSWTMNNPAYANATVSLTSSSNQSLYSRSYSFTDDGTSGSVSDKFLLPSSMNQSLLGTGRIVGSASGTGSSIEGAWTTMIYTAGPCAANPLYSPDCKGYAYAMAKQASASNNTSSTLSDGTQMQDAPPPGSSPPPGSPPPPHGSEPPPGSPPPPQSAQQPASSNTTNTSSVVNFGGLRPATQSVFADPSTSLSSSMIQGQFDMYSLQAPTGLNNKQPDVEVPQNEGIKVGGRSTLNDAMEQRPVILNANTTEQKTETVNRNVQPNELAGSVDITSMATQPAGYQAYSMMIPDVAFYAPKEIYKNQVNVDNAKVLRQLSSDRLHQEMVNQQYAPRN